MKFETTSNAVLNQNEQTKYGLAAKTYSDQKILSLARLAKEKYDNNGDPSHDFAHIRRVVELCEKMAAVENADLNILLPAAYLHDIVNVPKNHPDRAKASDLAANQAFEILVEIGYDEIISKKIAMVILEHSYSAGFSPSSIESAILQDADRLDSLGAIGVMRMVCVGSRFGSKFYSAEDPFCKERKPRDKSFMVDHFFTKLFKLGERMNTEFGRKEADKRIKFMKGFLSQLSSEIIQ